tara:strand:+ start:494 stop:1126 length:633 start_codon:yes stop_codon:yes gene_type:complete
MNNFNDNDFDFNNDNEDNPLMYSDKSQALSQKNIINIRNKVKNTNFDDIFSKKILNRNIYIKTTQLNKNIDSTIEEVLNKEVGGLCLSEGYIKENSCKVLLKSEGNLDISNFKATIYYTVRYEAMVCNPVEGEIIKCFVSDVNKTNIRAYVISEDESPLNIFLPKQHNSGEDDFIRIKEGDYIQVMVISKKFEYLDREILVIGKLLSLEE